MIETAQGKPIAIAVVVARKNSGRLPGKALLPFGTSTLIGHKIDQLKQCKSVSRIIVGSDSEDILDEARWHGAEIVKRADYYCDEQRCTANDMIADMVSKIDAHPDTPILWAHPTNPLVSPRSYDNALHHYETCSVFRDSNDSVVSVQEKPGHFWYQGTPLNFCPWTHPHQSANDIDPIYIQDGAIFIQSLKRFKETRYFYGDRPFLFEMGRYREHIDINDVADYDLAIKLLDYNEWGDGGMARAVIELQRQKDLLLKSIFGSSHATDK